MRPRRMRAIIIIMQTAWLLYRAHALQKWVEISVVAMYAISVVAIEQRNTAYKTNSCLFTFFKIQYQFDKP